MKSYWLLGLALVVAGGVLSRLLLKGPLSTQDLVHSFPFSTPGPILAATFPLGSCEAAPFLGPGWRDPGPHPHRETRPELGDASLRLYLNQPLPVTLRLEGRLADPATEDEELEVEVRLRQPSRLRFDAPLKVAKEWRRFELQVAGKHLSQGYNNLKLHGRRATQWRFFQARVSNSGRSFSEEHPVSEVEGQELRLPFGHSVAYPVQLAEKAWLNLDAVQPWLLSGAPPLAQGALLQVRLRSGSTSPPLDTSWYLSGVGPQRLHLQTRVLGPAELSLMALTSGPVQPGQAGLLLKRPRVESWDTPEPSLPRQQPLTRPINRRPNVILYLIDTLRADHLGCYGYEGETSPEIDRFSQDSVLFANCTAQSGWTKPATASILTSMLPRQHGALMYADKLPKSSKLLSQVLHQAGYETRAVVTNPFVNPNFGFDRGYDNFTYLERAKSGEVNEAILPWVRNRSVQKPFFLYLHTLDPHLPYGKFNNKKCWALQAASIRKENKDDWQESDDKKLKSSYRAAVRGYDKEIAANDESFGALLQALKDTGQYDNTLIVLVSDHGEELLDHGRMGHNNSLYQELLHVPLIIKFPGQRGAGTRILPCWQQIDIAPTVLASAGVEVPEAMAGQIYLPGGSVGERQRPALIQLKTTQSDWQGEGKKQARMLHMDAVRQGDWILTRTWVNLEGRLEPEELYNLADDPAQKDNLASSYPELTAQLGDLMRRGMGPETVSTQLKKEDVDDAMRSLHYLR